MNKYNDTLVLCFLSFSVIFSLNTGVISEIKTIIEVLKMIKGILFAVICCTGFITCKEFKQQNVGYFNKMNNAILLTENALTFSPNDVKDHVRQYHAVSTTDDIINRAEEILTSGMLDNPLFEVRALCLNHTKLFIKALTQRETWAVKSMLQLYYTFYTEFCITMYMFTVCVFIFIL